MTLFFQFFLLCIGLALLWKIGELAVYNAIGFSTIFGIERFTIGFFIFAISTGLPEITSAIVSSFKKIPELSAGNLMGASLLNMTLILGVVALLAKSIEIDFFLRKNLLWTIGLILIIFLGLPFAHNNFVITGILLISLYIGSIFWFQAGIPKGQAQSEIKELEEKAVESEKKPWITPKIDILLRLSGSLVALLLCSWLTVYAAANVAKILGIQLSIIGATLMAFGTTLPEFALEIHAVRRKEYALAFGDIFGSSLLNISFILGWLILFNPDVDLSVAKIILPFILATILWSLYKLIFKKPIIRRDGYLFLGIFVLYVITIGIRQYF